MTGLQAPKVDDAHEAAQADALRDGLVDRLIAQGVELDAVPSKEVEAALRAVPRHLFLPGLPLEQAYAHDSVVTKRDERGIAISSVSAPQIITLMLDQLQVRPGHRVLEIGSGGYNAALLAELAGADGAVTTVDIDQDVIDRARECLALAGYADVNVLCTDGEYAADQHAPYDRVIVTAGAWDIAPAWVDQLAEGGRIVVPIRMRGLTRSVAFEREDERLVSRAYGLCGFVPMRGAGANHECLVPLCGQEVALRVDDGQPIDADLLRAALSEPRVEAWSGVTVGGYEPFDDLDLWLSTTAPGYCFLTAERTAIDGGLVSPALRWGASTVFDGGTFAYLTLRPTTAERTAFEFGVYAHGSDGDELARWVVGQIRTWDHDHRSGPGPRFEAHPAGTPDDQLPEGLVLDKRHIRLTVSWP